THNLMDLIRRHRETCKGSIDRERSLAVVLESGDSVGEVIDPDPTPSPLCVPRENVSALRKALTRLPADEQAVIALRQFESLSFQEVGQRLDRTPEAARKLWSRAIARLQHMLEATRGTNR